MRYALYKRGCEQSSEISTIIKEGLKKNFIYDKENPEIVIVVGGDGTFLRAVHKYGSHAEQIKFIGLNTGTLGFLTSYDIDEARELVDDLIAEEFRVRKLPILKCELNIGEEQQCMFAINEITVVNPYKTSVIKVYIDDTKLETFRGTGLCISTPLGSTGYNRSLRGALVHPELECFQLTELASIHNKAYKSLISPFVLPGRVKLKLVHSDAKDATLTFDNDHIVLDHYDNIVISYIPDYIQLLSKTNYTYIERIKKSFL